MIAYNTVPYSLKDMPNWVVWKYETRDGKETKVPYDAKSNGDSAYAKVNDPSTWATFDRAAEVADVLSGHDYDGIGFMLHGTFFVGLDFDGVIQDGKPEPFVLEILRLLGNPYCEITPSGNGLRAFVEYPLALPAGKRKFSRNTNGKYGAEIYSGSEGGRYLTVTGNKFSGNGISKILDISLAYFMVSQIVNEKLKALWMGDLAAYDGDQSRADLALLGILARLFDNNAQKMEQAFSASKLGQREKWTQRKDYRDMTIAKAIKGDEPKSETAETPQDGKAETAATAKNAAAPCSVSTPVSGTADQVKPKKVVWLWQNRFAQKLNMLVGNPDLGKGLITHYVTACVTTGRNWFDATNTIPPSEVLIMSGEEDWEDTIAPRLMSAGADLTKVRWLKISVAKNGRVSEQELQLDRDAAMLENFLIEHPDIRLVIVDPISNYLGSAKMIDEQKVRAEVLTPLKEIANRRQVAVIGVMHLNKKVELDAIHRIGGAMAFVGVARMVWLVAPKPTEDGTESDDLVMVKVKSNIAIRRLKGLSYTTKARYLTIEDESVAVPYVEWIGAVDQTADELTGGKPKNQPHRPAEQLPACLDWLHEYLKDGPVPLKDVEADGKAIHGFSSKTIQRARERAEITTISVKRKSRDGRMRNHYICRLSVRDTGQYTESEDNQASF
jgi:hypothetical protein